MPSGTSPLTITSRVWNTASITAVGIWHRVRSGTITATAATWTDLL